MNRSDFLNMIENRATVNRQMVGEVFELINIFPYFQSAHMLLLKGLHLNNDVKFENQLRLSSIHIADREALYYLLKTEVQEEVLTEKTDSPGGVTVNNVLDTQQTVIELAKNSDQLISEIEKESVDDSSQVLQHEDNQGSLHSILITTETDNDESSGVMILTDDEVSPAEDKVFYMDPGFSFPDFSDLLELDIETTDTIIPEHNDRASDYFIELNLDSRKASQSELIDKFIIENPRIEPIRDKMNLPQDDISKPYTEEEGGFVTETLAKIYVNQGYYSKAIDIYEKLSLKFPEKSSYFATQIEKVKAFIKK